MAKTIVITGATSGFGRACAELFAGAGWQLVLCGRREERLGQLAQQLSGVPVHCACFDVRQLAEVEKMVAALPENFRAVDVLVNNAGLALGLNPAQTADLGDWEVMVDTNIKGLLYMTRLLLPGMVARKRGHIVNTGSIAGTWPYPGGNAYGATKAFVGQFSNNLRCDLHGTGVRVTNIEPGLAETEFSVVRFGGDKDKADAVYAGTEPLTAVDIAEIVHWVACRPAHVNINRVEVMPVCQSWNPFAIDRQ
ncbi:SDR family oxidoreductase [Desulfoprunum benzoelyticum]|uniref:3-hydroxy acid dehydrogenase/malonic semialdehyde reductase n=1 Tax=Desulfoprunum benzoelyticum TaxID=1506996 RepID=A0A840URH8_9BACT|nr:SDR family oxidoreductase [Desulfoprunum benzoelyticum]MBB5348255.1 3-hydroxy acid dehydrogenase/malonic semialdehyde reductase [Desulfoprunum benzoelyticum]MBM9529553.1 SDR family oxidoreductase [Desulfoprunum benzoelyticum]